VVHDGHEAYVGHGDGDGHGHRSCDEFFWVNADYDLAWIRPGRIQGGPLVTTGSPLDPLPGALGQPGTAVLFGSDLRFRMFSGLEMNAGIFLDDGDHMSLEAGGFVLPTNSIHFAVASNAGGSPLIARPFLDTQFVPPVATREQDSIPGLASGSAAVDAKSDLWGLEFNGRYQGYINQRLHGDVLAGFRYLHLVESLTTNDTLVPLIPGAFVFLGAGNFVNPPNSLADQDSFRTSDTFYGMQLGGRLRYEGDWFFVSGYAKLAGGITDEKANINGTTTLVSPNGNQVVQGGILALPSNIGGHDRSVFGLVPEFGLNIGSDITSHWRITAGYSFLLWNRVARPGDFVTGTANHTQIPSDPAFGTPVVGPITPVFAFNDERFWVHTFKCGIEYHY